MTRALVPMVKNCRHCDKEFTSNWYGIQCPACRGKKYRSGELGKENKQKNLVAANKYKMKKYYGMTYEEFDAKLEKQDNKCLICGLHKDEQTKRMSVDHDHSCCPGKETCGKCIRGVLCSTCNLALGGFKDNKVLLQRAIDYIESFGG
jgi:hypothetical protein